ncbi:unnamed protein product [Dicrocoelium dendriticum]|nr:unnamed protein product [Dicrocoelium dendriticum]
MNTVLSITVVTVALLCAYSTQVRSSDSLSDDKNGTEAPGDIRETESTQGKLEASVQFENTRPKIEVIERVTEQLKESSIKSGFPKQESGYRLTIPTERYQNWSKWSKCDPIECVESRRRECVDESWMQSDVNKSGARRCLSKYYEETRDCKNKTNCVTNGMLENCGVQTTKEDTVSNPTGAERTTTNSWPWLDSCERDCRSGLYCKIPYTNKWLLAGVRNYGSETECKPGTGIYTSALTRNEWLFSTMENWAPYMSHYIGK